MKTLRERVPSLTQVVSVFAVACIVLYGWTAYRFLQKLPSWLLYLNAGEILANYSHAVVFDFAEGLLLIGVVLGLSLLLPKRHFRDAFVARGSLIAILGIGFLMYLAITIGASKASRFPSEIFDLAPIAGLAIVLLAVALPLIAPVRKALEAFAVRAMVLLYVLVPATALGVIVFAFNNLTPGN